MYRKRRIYEKPSREAPEKRLAELKNRVFDIDQRAKNIEIQARREDRPLTPAERKKIAGLVAEFDQIDPQIKLLERLEAMNKTAQKYAKG